MSDARYIVRLQNARFELGPGRWTIGRAADCQIVVDDSLVSRHHAALVCDAEGVLVEDLGSRNGVRVNGLRVSGQRRLGHRDQVAVGTTELQLLVGDCDVTPSVERQTAQVLSAASSGSPVPSGMGVVVELVRQSVEMGRTQDALSILKNLCGEIDREQSARGVAHLVLRPASELVIQLGQSLPDEALLGWVFSAHQGVGALVDVGLAATLSGPQRALLRRNETFQRYLKYLFAKMPSLDPEHRAEQQGWLDTMEP